MFEIEIFNGSPCDDHSVEMAVLYLVERRIERRQMLGIDILGLMAMG
jgi:hypothetical protein